MLVEKATIMSDIFGLSSSSSSLIVVDFDNSKEAISIDSSMLVVDFNESDSILVVDFEDPPCTSSDLINNNYSFLMSENEISLLQESAARPRYHSTPQKNHVSSTKRRLPISAPAQQPTVADVKETITG